MQKIRLGGVPEHFNMPWHYALSRGLFQQSNIELKWHDYSGGTGAMATALRSNELDMAVMLTEGAIADIHKGADNTILGFYVDSPLIWGIHVADQSDVKSESEITTKKYAISRKGSGSHLMALVYANQKGYSIKEEQFVIVNTIDGAISSLTENQSDIFFWEKFMTNKFVQNNTFRRIGEYPTPWPCFVLVVKNQFYKENKSNVLELISIIESILPNFKELPDLAKMISVKYKLEENPVNEWLKTVEWSKKIKISDQEISNVKKTLTEIGVIQ